MKAVKRSAANVQHAWNGVMRSHELMSKIRLFTLNKIVKASDTIYPGLLHVFAFTCFGVSVFSCFCIYILREVF